MNRVELRDVSYPWLWAFGPYVVLVGGSHFRSHIIASAACAAIGLLLSLAGWLKFRRISVVTGGQLTVANRRFGLSEIRSVSVTQHEEGGAVRLELRDSPSVNLRWRGREAMGEALDAWADHVRERRFDLESPSRIGRFAAGMGVAALVGWAFILGLPTPVPAMAEWPWPMLAPLLMFPALLAILTLFSSTVAFDGKRVRIRHGWTRHVLGRQDVAGMVCSDGRLLVQLRDGRSIDIKTRSLGTADTLVHAWARG